MARNSKLPFSLYPLDPGFVPPKPRDGVADHIVRQMDEAGTLMKSLKEDGYYLSCVMAKNRVRLYTRGAIEVTGRFPQIVEDALSLRLPNNSLLGGEVVFYKEGKADFETISKIANSIIKDVDALRIQKEIGFAEFKVFSLLIYDGRDLASLTNFKRFSTLSSVFGMRSRGTQYLNAVKFFSVKLEAAQSEIKKSGLEGLVLYGSDGITRYKLDGNKQNPPRPDDYWKWKPKKEGDFIVRKCEISKKELVASKLYLSQIDPISGKEISCGEVPLAKGEDKEFFAKANYPLVAQVEFLSRYQSGKLREAVFVRLRPDKSPDECVKRSVDYGKEDSDA